MLFTHSDAIKSPHEISVDAVGWLKHQIKCGILIFVHRNLRKKSCKARESFVSALVECMMSCFCGTIEFFCCVPFTSKKLNRSLEFIAISFHIQFSWRNAIKKATLEQIHRNVRWWLFYNRGKKILLFFSPLPLNLTPTHFTFPQFSKRRVFQRNAIKIL